MTNPRLSILRATYPWIGRRETSRNQFVGMERVWGSTSYPDGWTNREPYCAAFVCHMVQQAMQAEPLLSVPARPSSPSCRGWQEWARNPHCGVLLFYPGSNRYSPEPGDIVNFLRDDIPGRLSHIGIVEEFIASTQAVRTVEGNSNSSGSRDGEGIVRNTRALSFCGEFYRLPAKAKEA